MSRYIKAKVANITVSIDAKTEQDAKARWERAKVAIDSLFVALENGSK